MYTATAVASDRGRPDINKIRILIDGNTRQQLWGVPSSGDLVRAPQSDTLAEVWLTSPQEGAAVSTTFTAEVSAQVFESRVVLNVRDGKDGRLVSQYPLTVDTSRLARGSAERRLTLPPGTYILEALYYSAKDGSIQALDDHRIVVQA